MELTERKKQILKVVVENYVRTAEPVGSKAIAAEMDEAKRKDLVKEYQELLWDQMPLVPVYHGYSFSVKASRLQGYNGFESAQNNQRVWEWSVTQ